MARKHLTLMIIPHEHGGVRSIRIPYAALKLVAAVGILAVVGGALFLVAWGRLAVTAAEAERLEAENARLRAVRGKVEDLARNLEASERAYRQIREMAGIRGTGARGDGRPVPAPAGSPEDPRAITAEERELLARSLQTTPRLWPLTKRGFVTEEFNPREGHTGLDIAVESNTPVLASGDGIVVGAGTDSVYGTYLVVQHDPATSTVYAHNALNFVADGDLVRAGDIIAQSGNSGRSTAPHLHFEVRRDGQPVDPRRYLQR